MLKMHWLNIAKNLLLNLNLMNLMIVIDNVWLTVKITLTMIIMWLDIHYESKIKTNQKDYIGLTAQ